ncbi:MAG: CBS domain-containing protein [bacterium]|nr:CBS domain-containing protein [bacterium]
MITVEDILMGKGPDIIVATSTDTVLTAVKLMAEDNVGSVIIRDDDEIRGIFTERDLLKRVVGAGKDPAKTTLEEVMSSPVNACLLSDDIRKCAKILAETRTRHLAVVEQGALVGLISQRDVQAAQARTPWPRETDGSPSNVVVPVFYEG